MRVIAGTARGRTVLAPRGMGTRPMMDIVKGSLFNMLESLGGIEGSVLDLFAGSGSLGIEALSRGAAHVDFVEQNREACQIISENLTRLGFAAQANIFAQSVERFLGVTPATAAPDGYGFVFMDAPYPARMSAMLLARLAEWPHLRDNGLVCIGHHKHEDLPISVHSLHNIKQRYFGASCISIYENSLSPSDN